MSAAPAQPVRAGRGRPAVPGRLLRLELRRNAMLWMLPLLPALFWFSTYRPSMALPAWWNLRGSMLQQQALLGLAPLAAGVAAWMGSREGRRRTADLVAVTALPRWAGQFETWAATTGWALVTYLGGVAVVYGATARQARWGGPLWWPVAVGAATVAASCAVGFAAGALLRGRFTAPLVAVTVFLALGVGAIAIEQNSTYAQIWPLNVAAGSADAHLEGGTLGMLRDLGGLIGAALLVAALLGGALAWIGPTAYLVLALQAIQADWTTPWIYPGHPPEDRGAAVCATLVFTAGILLTTLRGPRE